MKVRFVRINILFMKDFVCGSIRNSCLAFSWSQIDILLFGMLEENAPKFNVVGHPFEWNGIDLDGPYQK